VAQVSDLRDHATARIHTKRFQPGKNEVCLRGPQIATAV